MSRVADCLVAQLRKLPADDSGVLGELRRAIADELGGCSLGELQAAVQSLRFAGKLEWGRLALSPSMRPPPEAPPGQSPSMRAEQTLPPAAPAQALPDDDRREQSGRGPDDPDDDYPGNVNDIEPGAAQSADPARTPGADPTNRAVQGERLPTATDPKAEGGGDILPDRAAALQPDLRRAGVHSANTRAAVKPVPAPQHETEVARAAREEANAVGERRRNARSTATVSRPLPLMKLPPELKRYGITDFTLSEAIGTMLSDDPVAIMRAVSRKHPPIWRRTILLGRELGRAPMQTLYAALEAGLEKLEAPKETRDAA